jgi:hypothetical protein
MVDENRLTSIARRMLSPNREDLPEGHRAGVSFIRINLNELVVSAKN